MAQLQSGSRQIVYNDNNDFSIKFSVGNNYLITYGNYSKIKCKIYEGDASGEVIATISPSNSFTGTVVSYYFNNQYLPQSTTVSNYYEFYDINQNKVAEYIITRNNQLEINITPLTEESYNIYNINKNPKYTRQDNTRALSALTISGSLKNYISTHGTIRLRCYQQEEIYNDNYSYEPFKDDYINNYTNKIGNDINISNINETNFNFSISIPSNINNVFLGFLLVAEAIKNDKVIETTSILIKQVNETTVSSGSYVIPVYFCSPPLPQLISVYNQHSMTDISGTAPHHFHNQLRLVYSYDERYAIGFTEKDFCKLQNEKNNKEQIFCNVVTDNTDSIVYFSVIDNLYYCDLEIVSLESLKSSDVYQLLLNISLFQLNNYITTLIDTNFYLTYSPTFVVQSINTNDVIYFNPYSNIEETSSIELSILTTSLLVDGVDFALEYDLSYNSTSNTFSGLTIEAKCGEQSSIIDATIKYNDKEIIATFSKKDLAQLILNEICTEVPYSRITNLHFYIKSTNLFGYEKTYDNFATIQLNFVCPQGIIENSLIFNTNNVKWYSGNADQLNLPDSELQGNNFNSQYAKTSGLNGTIGEGIKLFFTPSFSTYNTLDYYKIKIDIARTIDYNNTAEKQWTTIINKNATDLYYTSTNNSSNDYLTTYTYNFSYLVKEIVDETTPYCFFRITIMDKKYYSIIKEVEGAYDRQWHTAPIFTLLNCVYSPQRRINNTIVYPSLKFNYQLSLGTNVSDLVEISNNFTPLALFNYIEKSNTDEATSSNVIDMFYKVEVPSGQNPLQYKWSLLNNTTYWSIDLDDENTRPDLSKEIAQISVRLKTITSVQYSENYTKENIKEAISNIIIVYNNAPTVAYRQNYLGINNKTFNDDDLLVISTHNGRDKIRLINKENNKEIIIDLSNGTISGLNFDSN